MTKISASEQKSWQVDKKVSK